MDELLTPEEIVFKEVEKVDRVLGMSLVRVEREIDIEATLEAQVTKCHKARLDRPELRKVKDVLEYYLSEQLGEGASDDIAREIVALFPDMADERKWYNEALDWRESEIGRAREEAKCEERERIIKEIESHYIKIAFTSPVNYATGESVHSSKPLEQQTWWQALKSKRYICTRESPWTEDKGRSTHPDAEYLRDKDYGLGEVTACYHCPNCGLYFEVELAQ